MSDFSGCFSLPEKLQSNIFFFISKGRSSKACEHFLSFHIAWCFVTQCCGTKYMISWELLQSDLGVSSFCLQYFIHKPPISHKQTCISICHHSFWMIIQSGLETTLKIFENSKCNINLETNIRTCSLFQNKTKQNVIIIIIYIKIR